jgi:hypothetical protein
MFQFFAYAVVGSLVIVSSSFLRGEEDKFQDFCVAAGLLVFVVLIAVPQRITVALHPRTMDGLLYRADVAIGLDPLLLCRFVYRHTAVKWLLLGCYNAIPLAMAVVYALERPALMVRTALIASVAAFICYNLVPAVGPAHSFVGFPWAAASILSEPAPLARNCVPSMHFGWALITAWSVQGRWLKCFAWSFVGVTLLTTVGLGEHYYVDLIVAWPFCWAARIAARVRP